MNNHSDKSCPHWDAGWCYSEKTPECTPCVGTETCSIYNEEHPAPPGFSDGPALTDYPGELV